MNDLSRGTILLIVTILTGTVDAFGEEKYFNLPFVEGKYVDNCLVWANQCGKPAADEFCRRQGFERAKSFTRSQAGSRIPTIVLSSRQVCNADFCVALSSVNCERADKRTFSLPRIDGNFVDNCLIWANRCGQPAANEFCRRNGFDHARSYKSGRPGKFIPTQILSSKQICNANFCVAFTSIECGRGQFTPTKELRPLSEVMSLLRAKFPPQAQSGDSNQKSAQDAYDLAVSYYETNCTEECTDDCTETLQLVTDYEENIGYEPSLSGACLL